MSTAQWDSGEGRDRRHHTLGYGKPSRYYHTSLRNSITITCLYKICKLLIA